MTNPTPEELKLVAEFMGLKPVNSRLCEGKVLVEGGYYSPLTNAEQSMGLLKMLLDADCELFTDDGYYFVYQFDDSPEGKSPLSHNESLELAIFQAALAHIKGSTKAEGEG